MWQQWQSVQACRSSRYLQTETRGAYSPTRRLLLTMGRSASSCQAAVAVNMDDLVTCPIDNNHRVRQSYLQYHLMKCDREYKLQCQVAPTVKPCRFDPDQWVEKTLHHDCRKMREYELWCLGRAGNEESCDDEGTSTEVWDDDGANSVSPAEESWDDDDGANSVSPAEESWDDDGANSVSPAEESWDDDGANSASTEENWGDEEDAVGRLRIVPAKDIIRWPPGGLTKSQRRAFRKTEIRRYNRLEKEMT